MTNFFLLKNNARLVRIYNINKKLVILPIPSDCHFFNNLALFFNRKKLGHYAYTMQLNKTISK